jgi:hypothetical protein
MKQTALYEVQKYGTTLEIDYDIRRVDSAFAHASPGGVKMYRIEVGSSTKTLIRVK